MLLKVSSRPRKHSADHGTPLVVYTLLVGNGTVAPIFIESKQPFHEEDQLESHIGHIEYLPPRVARRGERGMVACLEWELSTKFFSAGDILISDGEKALGTELVMDFLASHGIEKLTFPIGLGHLMNPCDNEFHAELKHRYYALLASEDSSTLSFSKQVELICQAYYGGTEVAIRHYFELVGLIGTCDPTARMKQLLEQGYSLEPGWAEMHNLQFDAYEHWCTL